VPISWTPEELMLVLELVLIRGNRTQTQVTPETHAVSRLVRKSVALRGYPLTDKLRGLSTIGMKSQHYVATLAGMAGIWQGKPWGCTRLEASLVAEYRDDLPRLTAHCDAIRAALEADSLDLLVTARSRVTSALEGRMRTTSRSYRERSRALAATCKHDAIAASSVICAACDFDFVAELGSEIGHAIVEVHHDATPVAAMTAGHITQLQDLAILCPTCHRIAHAGGKFRSVATVRKLRKRTASLKLAA
jgi:hypothetical protein